MRLIKSILIMALLCLMVAVVNAQAEDKVSGTVEMTSKSVAIGVGITWGDGVLKYQGQEHTFAVKGLSVIDVGVSKISVAGEVSRLDKLADFNGTYMAASAGVVVGGGVEYTIMKNQNNVVLKLKSTQKGLKLKLAPEGITLELK